MQSQWSNCFFRLYAYDPKKYFEHLYKLQEEERIRQEKSDIANYKKLIKDIAIRKFNNLKTDLKNFDINKNFTESLNCSNFGPSPSDKTTTWTGFFHNILTVKVNNSLKIRQMSFFLI